MAFNVRMKTMVLSCKTIKNDPEDENFERIYVLFSSLMKGMRDNNGAIFASLERR